MEANELLEPRKIYESLLKREHHDNVVEYFEELSKKAGIDIDQNALTMKRYYNALEQVQKLEKNKGKKKGLKVFLVILIVIFFIVFGIFLTMTILNSGNFGLNLLMSIVSPVIAVGLILVVCLAINPKIKGLEKLINNYKKDAEEAKQEGYSQLASLNALYDWNMSAELVHKTVPLIEMDKNFDVSKYQYLFEKFGFGENNDKKCSTVFVQSGSILGNPFLIETSHIEEMGTETYTGSLTYTYTVTISNGSGGTTTSTRTDTLYATLIKPKPYYHYENWLTYACEAAPDLSFSRVPSGINSMKDNQISKYIDKINKEIEKKAIKGIKTGFTPIGNPEFEALFKALNRNHEVQFRLLFTPLAQRNTVDLIRTKLPYGDDFTFIKDKMLNHIYTKHSQDFEFDCNPARFIHFDYSLAKKNFIEYMEEYFKCFFFDFAPLLNIPLYQQLPTDEYIFKKKYRGNVTNYEAESLANKYDRDVFLPKDCVTETILKTEFVAKQGSADKVNVHSYGYKTIPHVSYVPKTGKDGLIHQVPVSWLEYVPVSMTGQINVQNHNISRSEYLSKVALGGYKNFLEKNTYNNAIICERGLFSFLPRNADYDSRELDGLLK